MSSETLGIGFAPCGVCAAGYGAPATGDRLPIKNTPFRFLNPQTKDWQSTETPGILDGMSRNSQRVLLALMTVQGSSTSVPGFGNTTDGVGKVDETFEKEIQKRVRLALANLTDVEKAVVIEDIVVEKTSSISTIYSVYFYDLEKNQTDSVQLERGV